MNSKCGVQSKRKCGSHEFCVCIVGFPAFGCQSVHFLVKTTQSVQVLADATQSVYVLAEAIHSVHVLSEAIQSVYFLSRGHTKCLSRDHT